MSILHRRRRHILPAFVAALLLGFGAGPAMAAAQKFLRMPDVRQIGEDGAEATVLLGHRRHPPRRHAVPLARYDAGGNRLEHVGIVMEGPSTGRNDPSIAVPNN